MAFELEALVGHLYIAGGRTIKTTPPGALCEVAPKRAVRGREIDTLFVLVLPSGKVAPNTFYEQMSLMAAERYFSNTGSVTSALRDVYNTLNNNLFEHNASGRTHYEANMITAVMRGMDLYVGRAGASTLMLRSGGNTETIPAPLTDDSKLFMPPLGVQPIPEVEMSRYKLDRRARLILADTSLTEITEENLTKALRAGDIEKVLDDLKLLITLQTQMMVIEFVPPEHPVMVPAATGQSSAVIATELAAARAKVATATVDVPTATKAPATPRPKRETPQDRLKKRAERGAVGVARGLGHSMTRMSSVAKQVFGGNANARQRRRNATIIALLVFAIPAVLVSVVMFSWVGNVGETVYEECVGRANDAATVARALPSEQRQSLITAWGATLDIVGECKEYRPDLSDIPLNTLEAEAQVAVDSLSGISRRETSVVWASPDEGANLREIVIQGLDIYAFDDANNVVYRLQLSEDGTSIIGQAQPLQFMSIGARVEGNTLGNIVGIAFDEERNRIGALDENGVLVTCRPLSINDCESQQLPGFELIASPTRVQFWQNRLYVLDIGAEQIWRYQPIGATSNYADTPTEVYSGTVRQQNMELATDFVIGSNRTAING
ncbi:MAG: hypothetical protein AAFV98_00335, partial [Chloroflexota bacterium]